MAESCSLYEIMQMLIGFGSIRLKSSRIIEDLRQCTGLTSSEVVRYLEILDIKYIRINWSPAGRVQGISEILRYELDGLVEPEPVKQISIETAKPRTPRMPALPNPRECINCHLIKKIVSKGRCSNCRRESGICRGCDKERSLHSIGLCQMCYRQTRRKAICIVCGKEEVVYAKDKCSHCYQNTYNKEPKLLHNPT